MSRESMQAEIILTEEDVPGAKLLKDVDSCNVEELKRWLECHGQKRSGKKKVLLERVKGCIRLGVKMDCKVDGGKWYEVKANRQSNVIVNVSDAFTHAPEEGWRIFPSCNIPSMFNYGHVYYYLVESITNLFSNIPEDVDTEEEGGEGIDCEDTVTAKPLRKGCSLLSSNFVDNVQDNNSDEHSYMLRGHVHHSMKSDIPLQVLVTISKMSGHVKSCSCNCKANALGRCAHVAALLLKLSDYVKCNGCIVVASSTSKPCEWNKGKKRAKNPKALHETKYSSSKRKDPSLLYHWDPRPKKYQKAVSIDHVNKFVRDLQTYSASHNELSMWETLLSIKYEDFELDENDIHIYSQLVNNFETSLVDFSSHVILEEKVSGQVPDTEQQSNSDSWFQERWCRITASICKAVTLMGEKIGKEHCLIHLFNWMKNNFWFKETATTLDMLYGLQEEPIAIQKYEKVKGVTVIESGLWIHKKYPYLGASPDGLVYNADELIGIIEVKCLRILKTRTVDQILECCAKKELNKICKAPCFTIKEGKLCLRKGHKYYYQVQLQLLITEAKYCDFILHSHVGDPHIERIFKDTEIQEKIVHNCYKFWKSVMIPEYFLMRVPRDLVPLVL